MTIVVTGAAGFIGSNIVLGLNRLGHDDVIAVDDLTEGAKFTNLARGKIADYVDRRVFYNRFAAGDFGKVEIVFHQGACSDTMEHDGRYMMDMNYASSRTLYDACRSTGTRLLYASSAAVYGKSRIFREAPDFEHPLNVYGYSKLLFDQYVGAARTKGPQVVGLRYFNVYGPGEGHKGRMASVAFHQFNRLEAEQPIALFGAYGAHEAGEQRRDFVHVDDVVAVNLWAFANPNVSGVFNLGTGRAQSFNEVASAVLAGWRTMRAMHHPGFEPNIEYVDFPDALKGKYQSFTEADLTQLRSAGYDGTFLTVEEGVSKYVAWLAAQAADAISG